MNRTLPLFAACFIMTTVLSTAFQSNPAFTSRPPSSLCMAPDAEFEFQEMRVQLDAMKEKNIPSRDLSLEKRRELESYVSAVAAQRPSPVALGDIGKVLPGTKWRLGFSTEAATLGDLPRDADVRLEFLDDTTVDYILQFGQKTLGLNRLVAKSSYTFDSGPVNPGLLTFVYDDISTDVFGLKNISVGFFGLLKGRANYVESAFFDGRFWIERGTSPEGQAYYNVYVRDFVSEDADDDWR